MAMPNELILVRHGHSEGNRANEQSRNGDESLFTPEYRTTPGHRWHLTPEGIEQARRAGRLILENIGSDFDKYYVSPFVRTRETAAHLALPDAHWKISQRLRERDWGDIGMMPKREFADQYPQNAMSKQIDGLYWRPPGGESIADVRMRIRNFFDTMHREAADQKVMIVTHGEFMQGVKAELEFQTDEEAVADLANPAEKIANTDIFQYSRLDPSTGEQARYLKWVRRIRPNAQSPVSAWKSVSRRTFSNSELLSSIDE